MDEQKSQQAGAQEEPAEQTRDSVLLGVVKSQRPSSSKRGAQERALGRQHRPRNFQGRIVTDDSWDCG